MDDPAPAAAKDPPSPPGGGPEASLWQRLAHRLGLRSGHRLADSMWLWMLLTAVSLGAGFLVSHGLSGQQIPQLGPEDIGRPFRASSPSGFKAARDYEVVDQVATAQRRDEARAAVRPVFDYDPSVQTGASKAVATSFRELQELVPGAEGGPAEGPERPQTAEDSILNPPATRKATARDRDKDKERAEQELLSRFRDARHRLELQLGPLDDDDFEALVQVHFSREAERAVVSLVEGAYRSKVVSSRDELSRVDAQGITVRILGGSSEHVSTSAPPSVRDVREAQAELERMASIPGTLLPDAPGRVRLAVLRVAKRQIRPNLTINIAETDARRRAAADGVKQAVITLKKGQKVLGDGELINETHRMVVQAMREQTDQLDLMQLQVGGTGLIALLIAVCYSFFHAALRRFRPSRKDTVLLGGLLLSMLAFMHLWVTVADAVHDRYGGLPVEALYFAVPMAGGAMLVRFILSEEAAVFFAVLTACLAGVMLNNSLSFGVYVLMGSLVAAERISRAKDRAGIFKAGFSTGVVSMTAVVCFSLAEGKGLGADTWICAVFALVGTTVMVPVLVMALTPAIETLFGYASDIKLLELANLNHPALKELIVQAPGTYHHSIIIGSLVESAAEQIGANPLLARSCAYYHDIGKGRNPLYFGENQKGENRHDAIAPAMSAVIIKRHVTDGLEMARHYKLPRLVADVIPQHHGTRLVGYFFHKAVKELEGKEGVPPLDESVFRYPGPKPQFREAALVMIADAVEAASRSMPEPTTARLQALVQKLINTIFGEGQLDECDLTLKDLNLIAQSFVRTLEGIYHARPEYPPGALTGPPRPGAEAPRPPLALAKPEGRRTSG